MATAGAMPAWRKALPNLLLAVGVLLVLLLRRREQFRRPQVWDEEGTIIVHDFVRDGFAAFFAPVHDYYVTVSKIVSWLALQVSFLHYPAISTWLTAFGTAAILLAVANAPTLLRGKFLCALLVLLVPTNPEVFAVPLYLFWWSSILLFLLCLWDPDVPRTGWRLFLAALAGLSTPAIFLVMPVLAARVLAFRHARRAELAVLGVAGAAATIQLASVVSKGIVSGAFPLAGFVQHVVPKYFGFFVLGHWLAHPVALWAGGLALVGVLALWAAGERRRYTAAVLLYLIFGAIALASARISPADAHPDSIGPRYFFFPYLLVFWALVQLLASGRPVARVLAGIAIAAGVLNALPVFSRAHIDLRWKEQVLSCTQFDQYRIPIQYDGTGLGIWYLPLDGRTCAALLAQDPFHDPAALEGARLAPYRFIPGLLPGRSMAQLVRDDMHGADFARSTLPGLVVVGSFRSGDADTGSATFRLQRGDRILYRSGPRSSDQRVTIVGAGERFSDRLPVSLEWATLEFSNRLLPEEFTVQVRDAGQGYGEWSAYAVRPAAP